MGHHFDALRQTKSLPLLTPQRGIASPKSTTSHVASPLATLNADKHLSCARRSRFVCSLRFREAGKYAHAPGTHAAAAAHERTHSECLIERARNFKGRKTASLWWIARDPPPPSLGFRRFLTIRAEHLSRSSIFFLMKIISARIMKF